jgi:hypothetical protein
MTLTNGAQRSRGLRAGAPLSAPLTANSGAKDCDEQSAAKRLNARRSQGSPLATERLQ